MEATYTLTKGDDVVKNNATLQEIRDFTADLNKQINWKKSIQTTSIENLKQALLSNGYTLTEK